MRSVLLLRLLLPLSCTLAARAALEAPAARLPQTWVDEGPPLRLAGHKFKAMAKIDDMMVLSNVPGQQPSKTHIRHTLKATIEAYAEVMQTTTAEVRRAINSWAPVIFLEEHFDCALAHDGPDGCGGYIDAANNIIFIQAKGWQGCLANTSLMHFVVHYILEIGRASCRERV